MAILSVAGLAGAPQSAALAGRLSIEKARAELRGLMLLLGFVAIGTGFSPLVH